ncbi:hypothetical protein, partial [Pseudomonas syringae group genomosp. 7]
QSVTNCVPTQSVGTIISPNPPDIAERHELHAHAQHRRDSQTQDTAVPGRALSDSSAKTQQNVAQSP